MTLETVEIELVDPRGIEFLLVHVETIVDERAQFVESVPAQLARLLMSVGACLGCHDGCEEDDDDGEKEGRNGMDCGIWMMYHISSGNSLAADGRPSDVPLDPSKHAHP